MIKVSVIVPVYNAEKYLRKCMDSLVGQTLDEIEIIAVNDGSTDGSLEILKEYEAAHSDKVHVLSKENGGQASARNLALRHAEGEYIGYVDADDYADEDMFRSMCAEAYRSGADLTVCDHYHVNGKKRKYVRFTDYDVPRKMFGAVLVSPWNKLFRREVLIRSGVIFPEGYIYEDTAWFAELIPFIKTMSYVHEPLLYHMERENSTMTAAQGERTGQIFPVMDGVIDFYKQRGLYDEYKSELECFYVRILLFSSIKRIAKIDDKVLRKRMIKRTVDEIESQFPDYKKCGMFHGWKKLYVKSADHGGIYFMAALCRIRPA